MSCQHFWINPILKTALGGLSAAAASAGIGTLAASSLSITTLRREQIKDGGGEVCKAAFANRPCPCRLQRWIRKALHCVLVSSTNSNFKRLLWTGKCWKTHDPTFGSNTGSQLTSVIDWTRIAERRHDLRSKPVFPEASQPWNNLCSLGYTRIQISEGVKCLFQR